MKREAQYARGVAALEAGDLEAAERAFNEVLSGAPAAHAAWNALAIVALRGARPELAAARAHRALELDGRNPAYVNSLGIAQGELGAFAEAEATFRRALELKAGYPEALFNLAKAVHKQGRSAEALQAYERAYAAGPDLPGRRQCLAQMYRRLGRADRALGLLAEAPAARRAALAHLVDECTIELEGPERAALGLAARIADGSRPDAARLTLGLLYLSRGDWRAGWEGYLWRPNMLRTRRAAGMPEPLPAQLEGCGIGLLPEQGIGDVLFFLRFVPELRRRGARVALLCEPRLAALLAGDRRLDRVTSDARELVDCALKLHVGDVPAMLQSDQTPPAWTLQPQPERVERMRALLKGLGPPPYLGIAWRAGTDLLRGREFGADPSVLSKEVPPGELGAALRGWRGTIVAVQRSPYPGEVEAVGAACAAPVHDLGEFNDDLRDTTALLAAFDDYAAVSSTNMHLLAGLGGAARVLVPYLPDWRWMWDGEESPWFPGFRIYREPQRRGWSEPLSRLRGDLGLP